MSSQFPTVRHWNDDELIEHIYGVGPEDRHVDACSECQARLEALQVGRQAVEAQYSMDDEVDAGVLGAGRRAVYQRLEKRDPWWMGYGMRRWASAVALLTVLGAGAVVYENRVTFQPPTSQVQQAKLSDTDLVSDVSSFADSPEPGAAAPLEGLFED